LGRFIDDAVDWEAIMLLWVWFEMMVMAMDEEL